MTDARSAVLARIRQALTGGGPHPEDPGPDECRYRTVGETDLPTRVATFTSRAADYKVVVARVPHGQGAATAADILTRRGMRRIVLPADFPADLMPAGVELVVDHGLSHEELAACDGALTLCAVAIAETGTLVLDHGEGQGRRALTLLPDYHLCLVEEGRIVGLPPEAVAATEEAVRAGRPLTFISGPSATSDIELNRVEGVHGPRILDILILETPER